MTTILKSQICFTPLVGKFFGRVTGSETSINSDPKQHSNYFKKMKCIGILLFYILKSVLNNKK